MNSLTIQLVADTDCHIGESSLRPGDERKRYWCDIPYCSAGSRLPNGPALSRDGRRLFFTDGEHLMLRLTLRSLLLLCVSVLMPVLCANASQQDAAPAQNLPQEAPALGSLAPTPPMGWASWNHYFCDYNEKTIREQADALVSTGMRDAGYKYVIIQECIARKRDADGNLIADPARFPSGMTALSAYIHKLGLKTGIYTDIGRNTCYSSPHYEGSYGHEQQDADTFAAWGMDLVEMDYCNRVQEHTGRWVYERMAEALKKTGRPMVFYLCSWGNEQPWEWAQGKAQMWRTYSDISLEKDHADWGNVVRNFESNTIHSVFSAPESWNDADMLEIGNRGLSDMEAQAQMSMWAISPSPLLAGADLTHMSARTRGIYTNREVLAVNQDPLGAGADKIAEAGPGLEVWARSLGSRTGGDYAVMLLNATKRNAPMEVRWSQLDLLPGAKVRDLWLHKNVPTTSDSYRATVPAQSALLLRISGIRSWKHGVVYEAEWPGIQRIGVATLFPRGECSRGYAMALGGENKPGSLRISNIVVLKAGKYTLRLQYTRNGLENKLIDINVNGAQMKVLAIMRSRNWVDVPITLHTGGNEITVSYDGQSSFYLDNVMVLRSGASAIFHAVTSSPS